VKQRMLETVIPAPGEKVLFVEGKNKGKIGKLMSKTTENGETKAVVQAAADFSVGHYSLDSICSYVGDSYE
jgi:ribosomal protein S4E